MSDTIWRVTDTLSKLGAGGMMGVLALGGLLYGGYLLIEDVVAEERNIVESNHGIEAAIVDLTAAIHRLVETNERHHAENRRLQRGLVGVTFATCIATSNGSQESMRNCETAMRELPAVP